MPRAHPVALGVGLRHAAAALPAAAAALGAAALTAPLGAAVAPSMPPYQPPLNMTNTTLGLNMTNATNTTVCALIATESR